MAKPSDSTNLIDAFGRVARDLRVSLTDRCNLRCTYCMPAEGMDWLPNQKVLTDEEISRLLRIAVEELEVTKIRFTGGEPLLRKGLESIVGATAKLRTKQGQRPELTLTTNALGLHRRAEKLAAQGLDRVNISLDSLDRDRYAKLARRDRLPDVLAGIEAAAAAGLTPVKINAVIMPKTNEVDILPLARFALSKGHQLRFIEQMPLGPREAWKREQLVTQQEILDILASELELSPAEEPRGAAPAQLWHATTKDGAASGEIGVIASVTAPFCGACDRTRLTADGQMRNCLFARGETDLRGPMREGATDEELADIWRGGQWIKRAGHGIGDPDFEQPARTMSAIGG